MIKHTSSEQIDPLEILREEARAAALCHGVERCDELAAALVARCIQRLGGAHIYIPKKASYARRDGISEIRRKFDGNNLRELAKEYGFSIRHTRRILFE